MKNTASINLASLIPLGFRLSVSSQGPERSMSGQSSPSTKPRSGLTDSLNEAVGLTLAQAALSNPGSGEGHNAGRDIFFGYESDLICSVSSLALIILETSRSILRDV